MYNEAFFWLAIFSALLVYMTDYSFGQPGNDKWYSTELFSGYPFLIAQLTLMKYDKWEKLKAQLTEQLLNAASEYEKKLIIKSFKEMVFSTAQPLFTFQKAIGMCPICFHLWVSLFLFSLANIFFLKESIIIFTTYLLLSHLFIRILKKYF